MGTDMPLLLLLLLGLWEASSIPRLRLRQTADPPTPPS
jgi:hypothetical protein